MNNLSMYGSSQIYNKRKRVSAFIVDETVIQIGNHHFCWLWIAIEPVNRTIVGIYISKEKNMFVAENFLSSLVDKYGKHTVYTDGKTWYTQACNFLHLKHTLHSPLEKSCYSHLYYKINNFTSSRILIIEHNKNKN